VEGRWGKWPNRLFSALGKGKRNSRISREEVEDLRPKTMSAETVNRKEIIHGKKENYVKTSRWFRIAGVPRLRGELCWHH